MPRPTGSQATATEDREARVNAAVSRIVDLFASGELPARIAQTVLHRAECDQDTPSAKWSLQNQLLMLLAGTADARGFHQWHEVGRSVRKGAKCFHILGPSTVRKKEVDEHGAESTRTIVVGFHAVAVFRYEDTEGEPLVRPDYTPAAFPPLYDVAQHFGCPVRWVPFTHRFRGYYQGRPGADEIVLCTHDERTFFHELGHAAHARVLAERGGALAGGQDPKQEIVAEVVAATLCSLYGFEGYLAHSAEYIAGYGGKDVARAVSRVLGDVERSLALILATSERAGDGAEGAA